VTQTVKTWVKRDLRVAFVPWALARVLVVGTLALTRFAVDHLQGAVAPIQLRQGLFSWDAAFYRDIAERGYEALPESALRFFPLVPLLARALGTVLLDHDAVALIVIANGSALVFGALLYRIALRETGDEGCATRAAWFGAIFPPAVALVLGYAEATFMMLSVLVFLFARSRRFAWAIPMAILAGLTRPIGVLLVIPIAIEAVRTWERASPRDRVVRVGAIGAPLAGAALYLLWANHVYGDFWMPLRLQNSKRLRGGFVDPFTRVYDGIGDLFGGDRFGSGLHVLWIAVFLALLVVVFLRLPVSYGAYAGAAMIVSVSARNLDSFERYAMSAFPLLLGVAIVTSQREVERAALVVAAAGLVGYSVLAFLGVWVP
jgi:hypothetical protein